MGIRKIFEQAYKAAKSAMEKSAFLPCDLYCHSNDDAKSPYSILKIRETESAISLYIAPYQTLTMSASAPMRTTLSHAPLQIHGPEKCLLKASSHEELIAFMDGFFDDPVNASHGQRRLYQLWRQQFSGNSDNKPADPALTPL